MTNIFINRVAKLLDGLPLRGYSESCKPIRASAVAQKKTGKQVTSEFELHNKVLHNTWGRIEFEIEQLNQAPPSDHLCISTDNERDKCDGHDNGNERKTRPGYTVRVKTKHVMTPSQRLKPASAPGVFAPCKTKATEQNSANKQDNPSLPLSSKQDEDKLLSLESKKSISGPKKLLERERIEIQKNKLGDKYQSAKRMIRKEFACRESQRMMTLINNRKEQAALLQEKSVFVNFALPVLETLAKSPQTPKNSLKWLAFHENSVIRKAVAKNRNTDLEVLGILARDENEGIRMAVAENPLVDKEFLLKLLNDDQDTVVKKAQDMLLEMTRSQAVENNQATLSALNDYVHGVDPKKQYVPKEADFMQVIAAKDTTPANRLAQLSKHDDWNVRLAVANNPNTTARTLSSLAEDSVAIVRRRVVLNHNCPSEIKARRQQGNNTGTQTTVKVN